MYRSNHTYIIAEAGVNHNGSLEMAKQLIDVAVEAKADAVKFQTFKAEKLVNKNAPKADYQKKTTDAQESQYEMIKKLELNEDSHHILIEYCKKQKIQFLSSPFDSESVDLLANTLNLPFLKIPSGEITNAPLLLKIACTGKSAILSTGMCLLNEVEAALGVLAFGYLFPDKIPSLIGFQQAFCSKEGQAILQEKVTVLHCTSEYPAPFAEVNLFAMDTLRHAFGLRVGFSDHTDGISIPIAAVARGATVIEKHFTLDKNLSGPDHKASLEPSELKKMISSIREVELALGAPLKQPSPSEVKNMLVVRKSLVADKNIKQGEKFSAENLAIKRPGGGVSPLFFWDLLGKKANRDYSQGEIITI